MVSSNYHHFNWDQFGKNETQDFKNFTPSMLIQKKQLTKIKEEKEQPLEKLEERDVLINLIMEEKGVSKEVAEAEYDYFS
ncbi:hypothetical protein PRO82_002050 [Candidatus Protochlamydia amoebophila]|uniref:hypothetical protein n=1 Tax=Candidatus Protochlamydia amoebophila TaxID=362787 RepID=UPI001BCA3182|nr:hypothetical protein [Candidatus Protochlamydia amoebophila]MBS4164719.1 hypothetical protein [Candidatus Protochlamydia amoebophila]